MQIVGKANPQLVADCETSRTSFSSKCFAFLPYEREVNVLDKNFTSHEENYKNKKHQ